MPPVWTTGNQFYGPKRANVQIQASQKTPVTEVIIHETVTTSVPTTVQVLQRRNLGVHFIIAPNGEITQHSDLATDVLSHAPPHNKRSVGIELVTPYYPKYLRPYHPWQQVINAKWAHKKQYVVPTLKQAEACAKLLKWLTSNEAVGLDIPRNWAGLRKNKLAMGRTLTGLKPKPGIHAHTYFGHADGSWPALYAWLRIEKGLPPEIAYTEAIKRAAGKVRKVDLSDFIPN